MKRSNTHMNQNSPTAFAACLCALLLFQTAALAQIGEALSSEESFLVVTRQAAVMSGDKQLEPAQQGTHVVVSRVRGPWKYVPKLNGWVHQRDLVSVEEADSHFTKKIETEPTAENYHLRGIAHMLQQRWDRATHDLEEAYEKGESSVSLHFNLASCYRELGLMEKAIQEYDSILKAYPDEYSSWFHRGHMLIEQGNYNSGLSDFNKAIELRPESAEAHAAKGIALRMLGRYDEAVDLYTRALELDPKDADTLANRAYAQKSLGQLALALNDYEAALKLDSDAAGIKNDLAWLLATTADENIVDAQRAYTLAKEICDKTDHEQPEFVDTLGAAHARLGEFEAAVEAGLLAESLMKDNPGVTAIQERIALYREKKPFIEVIKVTE